MDTSTNVYRSDEEHDRYLERGWQELYQDILPDLYRTLSKLVTIRSELRAIRNRQRRRQSVTVFALSWAEEVISAGLERFERTVGLLVWKLFR